MGRKKRNNAATAPPNNTNAAVHHDYTASGHHHAAAPLPPPPMSFDHYGRPIPMPPPPMPQQEIPNHASKRSRAADTDDAEEERQNYPVKKYRSDSYYRSIEAFQRYTKAHRMLDASYVRWTGGGGTPEKPNVFGIRIAGSFLSWGRGKTRDAAIDASIRAAFALVAAHGYDDFACNEDCFTQEPFDAPAMAPMPPPPPPPPLPMGMAGAPPLPPGLPPPLPAGMGSFAAPPGAPPQFALPQQAVESMIPQPVAPKAELAVASTVVVEGAGKMIGLMAAPAAVKAASGAVNTVTRDEVKKGNRLVFAGDVVDDQGEEMCMEELRMMVPRYWTLVVRALVEQ